MMPTLPTLLHWTSDLCAAGAVLGIVYTLLASILVLRFQAGRRDTTARPVPVTVLVPLCGDEPGLQSRLMRLCTQAYAGPVQIVFGAQDASDPAIAIAKRVQAARPPAVVDIEVNARSHGCNRKISNLTNMADRVRHDVVVMIDSDIDVEPDYLARIIGELQKPGVGAVTCLYYGLAGSGFWSRLSALSINSAFLPSVIVALTFGLARPCFGATIAMRRELLNRIGGFDAFADCLADDYLIGEAVRACGYQVSVPWAGAGHVCGEDSLRDLTAHQTRYARTIRNLDPIGYAGAIITHPLPLALIALLLGGENALLLTILAASSRLLLCACVQRCFPVEQSGSWLLPFRDVLSFSVYLAGFVGTRVSWRGYRYRLNDSGTLSAT